MPDKSSKSASTPGVDHVQACRDSGFVLVIDDDVECRELVSLLLKSEKIAVQTAADLKQALKTDLPNARLVLVDLNMPRSSGLAVARGLREQGYLGEIVAYTGSEPTRKALAEAGINSCMSKDTPTERLIALCREHMTSSNRAGASVDDWHASRVGQALMQTYLAGLERSVAALTCAASVGNAQEIAAIAHRMAGSGALYGLPKVSELGRQIFDAAKSPRASDHLDKLIGWLKAEVASARGIFRDGSARA
jgi:CheY-like chemotaxis protein/HPt (histidine-containing phosphotransfer) domain-containing protein